MSEKEKKTCAHYNDNNNNIYKNRILVILRVIECNCNRRANHHCFNSKILIIQTMLFAISSLDRNMDEC